MKMNGEGLGIVEMQLHFHVAEVAAMKALGNSQRFAVGVAGCVQPGPIV